MIMHGLIAQTSENLGNTLKGIGPLGLENKKAGEAPALFNQVVSITIGVMTVVAGIYFIFLIISGAISWMTAGGDKGAIEDARKRIMNGIIGLIIVIAAIFIAQLIGYLIGFNIILNPANFIMNSTL